MGNLSGSDKQHLQAAEGWLDLGNHLDANEELEKITASLRTHPDVLLLRWQVYAQAEKWDGALAIAQTLTKQLPKLEQGWLYLAETFHGMGKTSEAYETLLGVAEKFSDRPAIAYQIGVYACALDHIDLARNWIRRALSLGDDELKVKALDDPALDRLWRTKEM